MTGPFESARLKADRGLQHLRALESELVQAVHGKEIKFVDETADGKFRLKIFLPEFEIESWSLLIGDVVNNLRASLDHAVWRLVELDGGDCGTKTNFPIGAKDEASYAKKCKDIGLKTDRAVDFLRSFNILNGGSLIYLLNKICNIDKHRYITVVAKALNISDYYYVEHGSKFGIWANGVRGAIEDGSVVMTAPAGHTVEFAEYTQFFPTIIFSDQTLLKGRDVMMTLAEMHKSCLDVLDKFDDYQLKY